MKSYETAKFEINYFKTKIILLENLKKSFQSFLEEDIEVNYNPYNIENLQLYNPIYSEFFKMNNNNFSTVSLNNDYSIIDLQTVEHNKTKTILKKPIYIKFSPVLDPIR